LGIFYKLVRHASILSVFVSVPAITGPIHCSLGLIFAACLVSLNLLCLVLFGRGSIAADNSAIRSKSLRRSLAANKVQSDPYIWSGVSSLDVYLGNFLIKARCSGRWRGLKFLWEFPGNISFSLIISGRAMRRFLKLYEIFHWHMVSFWLFPSSSIWQQNTRYLGLRMHGC